MLFQIPPSCRGICRMRFALRRFIQRNPQLHPKLLRLGTISNGHIKAIHSVSEYKKRYIRNSTQILENLRNAVVGFFGLRNKFVNVQRNKKLSTQNVFKLRNRKKINALCFICKSLFFTNSSLDVSCINRVEHARRFLLSSAPLLFSNMYQKVQ